MYLSGTQNADLVSAVEARAMPNANAARSHLPNACRILDILISLFVLIFVLPLMVVVAVVIKIQDGGPIFFGHVRIGYQGRMFRCWKFRSMVVDAEAGRGPAFTVGIVLLGVAAILGQLVALFPPGPNDWTEYFASWLLLGGVALLVLRFGRSYDDGWAVTLIQLGYLVAAGCLLQGDVEDLRCDPLA